MPAALVTGAARGIGRAIAGMLGRHGFDIAAVDIDAHADSLMHDVAACGRKALYVQQDIAAIDAHASLVERVWATLGPIDCLVNDAGVTSLVRGDMLDLAPESFDRCMQVNLRGTFFLTQAVARRMIATPPGHASAYRAIVTITSANAEIVGADRADYCVSKAGLSMASKLFAVRLAEHRIHVFEVRPGIIATDMTTPAVSKYDAMIASGGVPLARWGTPEDVGETVVAVALGRLPYATGEIINVGGGLHLHRV